MPDTTDAELAEQLATLRRKMVAAATDEATPEQRASWKAFDEEMARRIHRARPGVPLHHAFATLETLRAIQRYEAGGAAPAAVPSAPADRAAILQEAADAVMRLDYMELRADFEYDSQRDAWDGGTIDAANELRRMADETRALPSIHANDVEGFCPACGHPTLYVGAGGHLVCALMDCPKPEAADTLLRRMADEAQQPTSLAETIAAKRQEPALVQLAEAWSTSGDLIDDGPPAPLRRAWDDCPGFPDKCPNIRPVDPDPPTHLGGIRCGCADKEA